MLRPHVVVYEGHHIGPHRPRQAEQHLPGKIVHAVAVVHLGRVGAGAVEHDQAEADEEDDGRHQAVVEVLQTVLHTGAHRLGPPGGTARRGTGFLFTGRRLSARIAFVVHVYTLPSGGIPRRRIYYNG